MTHTTEYAPHEQQRPWVDVVAEAVRAAPDHLTTVEVLLPPGTSTAGLLVNSNYLIAGREVMPTQFEAGKLFGVRLWLRLLPARKGDS